MEPYLAVYHLLPRQLLGVLHTIIVVVDMT